MGNDVPHHGKLALLQACTLLAKRLATGAGSFVFTLDIVASVAVSVVVVHGLLD